MRPTSTCLSAATNLIRSCHTGSPTFLGLALMLGLGLGACAGKQATGNPCLDRCTARAGTELERSTCELECTRVAAAPPAPAPAPDPLAPGPDEAQRGHYVPPPASTPASPTPTARTYPPSPTSAANANAKPAPAPAPTPVTVPSAPPGPSAADLQRQRGLCESQCDSEGKNTDRATCRLQCAQITDNPQPSASGRTSSNTPAYVNHPTTPPNGQGGAVRPAPADPSRVAACEAGCNAQSVPATDRATCKLNCSATGSVGPAPSSYYVMDGSQPPPSGSREAVIRSSPGVVQPTGKPPVANQQKVAQCAAQAQQCSSNCSTRLSPCTSNCDQGKLSATDRATCKLTCESNVDVCRDDCRIKEGNCRG